MAFTNEKQERIKTYILEKIANGDSGIASKAMEAYEISRQTAQRYINELIDDGRIIKLSRDSYELVNSQNMYVFKRSDGQLDMEDLACEEIMKLFPENLPQNIKGIWVYVLSEMINNVIDHSDAENLYAVVGKDSLKTYVLLYDDGVGIFSKIKNYFGLSDIGEAVAELFKGKLTTDSNNHSGEGIFFSSRLMDSFVIFSSDKIFAHNRFGVDELMDIEVENGLDSMVRNSGTCIYMALSNSSTKTTKDIFDEFASVDGGFAITKLKIRNMFDSDPVSRSQAKRLYSRLDSFKKIIIDYQDVDWIGQGFAHQLYVVFKNAHPEIEIESINMNEDVRKMLVHVSQ